MHQPQQQVLSFMRKAQQDVPNGLLPVGTARHMDRVRDLAQALRPLADLADSMSKEFHSPDGYPALLRAMLMLEETTEFIEALAEGNTALALDGLCDIVYVAYGAAVAMGVDLQPFFEAVHGSNMAKFGPGGFRREDGRWQKPADWKAPDLEGMVNRIRNVVFDPNGYDVRDRLTGEYVTDHSTR